MNEHRINEMNENYDNGVDTSPNSMAYEIELKNIVVHPNYLCQKPDNDIGMSILCIFFLSSVSAFSISFRQSLHRLTSSLMCDNERERGKKKWNNIKK